MTLLVAENTQLPGGSDARGSAGGRPVDPRRTLCAADVMIGTDLFFGIELFKIVASTPVFRAYVERCQTRPAMQRALALDAGATAE